MITTLLELTQNILSAMDSDEVNSISDTVESMQVAEVIKETYLYITNGIDIPARNGLIQLDGLADPDRPNVMRCPTSAEDIQWIKYNSEDVTYMTPLDFVNWTNMRANDDAATQYNQIWVLTDRDPRYYTSFDDLELVFDAVNLDEDSTLHQSKTMCWGQKSTLWEMTDDFVPNLPPNLFPRLLAEAKATCFINFKQAANAKEEQRSRQELVRNQNERWRAGRTKPIDRLPNYARKRR